MWVQVTCPDGSSEDRDYPVDENLRIGDILLDGAVVVDLLYPDDCDICGFDDRYD